MKALLILSAFVMVAMACRHDAELQPVAPYADGIRGQWVAMVPQTKWRYTFAGDSLVQTIEDLGILVARQRYDYYTGSDTVYISDGRRWRVFFPTDTTVQVKQIVDGPQLFVYLKRAR
jgi:hypothetical protein